MSLEEERRQRIERKRNLIYLIQQYLSDIGLTQTKKTLTDEYKLTGEYKVCENVDLEMVYMEYASYFQLKFGKKPIVLRKNSNSRPPIQSPSRKGRRESGEHPIRTDDKKRIQEKDEELLSVLQIVSSTSPPTDIPKGTSLSRPIDHLPQDWKEIADNICRDIITAHSNHINFDKVHGVLLAKNVLRESVLLPLERPELFGEDCAPWRTVLLHGPPGTGKTLLAKALCCEGAGKVTFFNTSPSTITSKWRGDSEKYIRVLFELARHHSPSIIFIDEIESLTSRRGTSQEHESSKRFKSEFLSLLDGLTSDQGQVFVLCSSNLPWDIDAAFLRRFEHKILVGLPNLDDRIQMLRQFLPITQNWPEATVHELATISDGFTGDDLRIVAKEVNMIQIRKVAQKPTTKGKPTVTYAELKETLLAFKTNSCALLEQHIEWSKSFGFYQTIN